MKEGTAMVRLLVEVHAQGAMEPKAQRQKYLETVRRNLAPLCCKHALYAMVR